MPKFDCQKGSKAQYECGLCPLNQSLAFPRATANTRSINQSLYRNIEPTFEAYATRKNRQVYQGLRSSQFRTRIHQRYHRIIFNIHPGS